MLNHFVDNYYQYRQYKFLMGSQRLNRIYFSLCKRKQWLVKILGDQFNISPDMFDNVLEMHYDMLMIMALDEYELHHSQTCEIDISHDNNMQNRKKGRNSNRLLTK